MFDPALICTDLSETSDRLIGCSGHLKALGIREAVLAHAIDPYARSADADSSTVERQCRLLESFGIKVHLDLAVGHPSFSLAEIAQRHGTRITVVASNGKGLSDAPFSGSVSSDLLLMSRTPVLVTPTSALGDDRSCSLACGRLLESPLIALDFSDSSMRAFDATLELAPRFGRATLLHVQDVARMTKDARRDSLEQFDTRDRLRLEQLCERLRLRGTPEIDCAIEYGDPADVIGTRAALGGHTLVVVGGHGRSDERSVVGGVSDRLMTAAEIPVLVVP